MRDFFLPQLFCLLPDLNDESLRDCLVKSFVNGLDVLGCARLNEAHVKLAREAGGLSARNLPGKIAHLAR